MEKTREHQFFDNKIQKIVSKSYKPWCYEMRKLSRMQEVDLTFLIFFSYFYFLSNIFFSILFLEPGLEGQDHTVTQQVTSDDMVTSYMMYKRM